MRPSGMRIAILFHESERGLDPRAYIVGHLAECWREDGLEVIHLYGIDQFVPAARPHPGWQVAVLCRSATS